MKSAKNEATSIPLTIFPLGYNLRRFALPSRKWVEVIPWFIELSASINAEIWSATLIKEPSVGEHSGILYFSFMHIFSVVWVTQKSRKSSLR